MNLHRLAELRSIALHAAVAERLADRPDLVERARARIAAWARDGRLAEPYASRSIEAKIALHAREAATA